MISFLLLQQIQQSTANVAMNLFTISVIGALLASAVGILQIDNFSKIVAIVIGILGWVFTRWLIPIVRQLMLKKGINGLDINKKGSEAGEKPIPECLGFASAVAFCMVGLMLTPVLKLYQTADELSNHLTVLVTVFATVLLGFADDILDLKWRYKLLFPFFIIIPLVSIYDGITHFQVIYPFSIVFGRILELGPLYLFYITCLGIYKTNTINIYAGINGLEVGQSIVAACGMLLYFAMQGFVNGYSDRYNYSVCLLLCFLGVALALLKLNQYPSQVFVGDTFCYFAGIVLAIAAIFGEIPVVSHWFFIPQLINFLYSMPQLTGYVPCPRHRLALYDSKNDKLMPVLTNMNMLNLSLRWWGPTNEGTLCLKLLSFQAVFSLVPLMHLFCFGGAN